MKTFYFFLLLFITTISYSQVHVRGYYRKDGTYIRPHERTVPNSTITDNYSYQGNYNPNLEYNTPLPKTTYNYYSNSGSSGSSSVKEWVNGYYRKDGTYVSGYYRYKRKATNTASSYNNKSPNNDQPITSNTLTTKKYVNTEKVNFRTSPETGDNIISELSYSDEVTSLAQAGYWDKVIVKRYNPQTYGYETFEGYINSRYLSDYSSTTTYKPVESYSYSSANTVSLNKNDESKYFVVKSSKAYFHSSPDVKNRMKAYLVYGETIKGIAESKYFIYTEFTNSGGIKTIGWILKDDLISN